MVMGPGRGSGSRSQDKRICGTVVCSMGVLFYPLEQTISNGVPIRENSSLLMAEYGGFF